MFIRARGNGLEPLRFLLVLVTTSLGWVVIGAGLLIGGLIWGLNSHQASYQSYQFSSNYHIGTGTQSGNVYINADGSNEYFAAFEFDFSPTINPADIDKTAAVTFIARTDTSTLNPALNSNGTIITSAHKVEKLVLYDQYGNIIRTYTTAEYNANPHGYNANYWLYGGILMLVGLLCAGNGLLFFARGKQRQKEATAVELASLESRPSPFARELGETASVQTYQGTEQYPQPYNTPYRGPRQ